MGGSRVEGPEAVPSGQDLVGDRARLFGIGIAAVFGANALFAVLRLLVTLGTGRVTPWWVNAASAGAVVLVYLFYRGNRAARSTAGVHLMALIATIALVAPVAYGMSSSKWWLALVGFAVTVMGRRREALVWAPITILLLPAIALLEPYIQIPDAAGETPIERAMAGLIFGIVLLGITLAFRRVADLRARELGETAASLARANAVKSRFLAHMSHEVRTPLHGVIAMTDMAMQSETSDAVRGQIAMAQQSARVLLGLLNNVLEVTRAESDAIELERRPFLLHAALSEVLRPLAVQARARGLRFEARADPGLSSARVGDRVRFGQIALNLAGNALKFTEEGSIQVALRAVPGQAERVELVVTDTGPGIAKEKQATIFEPFVQANTADARRDSGAGLGLAIVRELVKKMEGSVRVESELGKGSTFIADLLLPFDPSQPNEPGPEESPGRGQHPHPRRRSPRGHHALDPRLRGQPGQSDGPPGDARAPRAQGADGGGRRARVGPHREGALRSPGHRHRDARARRRGAHPQDPLPRASGGQSAHAHHRRDRARRRRGAAPPPRRGHGRPSSQALPPRRPLGAPRAPRRRLNAEPRLPTRDFGASHRRK